MQIRYAKENDANKLLSIYKEYINTAITFEYEAPSRDEFLNRIKNIKKKLSVSCFRRRRQNFGLCVC